MTEIEYLDGRLRVIRAVMTFLKNRLAKYETEEQELVMKLTRARRLEREARELQ